MTSDADAQYADTFTPGRRLRGAHGLLGHQPGTGGRGVPAGFHACREAPSADRDALKKAYDHTGFSEGEPIKGLPVDVAFIGSCTNGRISDLREAARVVKGRKVSSRVKALVVPGSRAVLRQAEAEGLPEIFRAAGFEWRDAGLLHVPGHEPGQAERPPGLRQLVEQELHRPAGLAARPHAAHEPGHGRRRGHCR